MSRVLYHMAHDPVGNSESVLTEYDAELIARASEKGIVFVAVDEDGGRTVVPPEDVTEPVLEDQPITLVQPSYVDDRIASVIDVFDALASEYIEPQASLMSVEAGEAQKQRGFFAALAALKELAASGGAR